MPGPEVRRCRNCGKPEHEHCVFEPMPTGCICPPGEWDGPVEPICGAFVGEPGKSCERCEHDEACHTGRKEA